MYLAEAKPASIDNPFKHANTHQRVKKMATTMVSE